MKVLKKYLIITDFGFIIYWLITLLHLIPNQYLFKDYNNVILMAWNWSFFPLDIFTSIAGITTLYFYRRKNEIWNKLIFIALILTFCSGLQAIAFWTVRKDFEITWWIPNLFLLLYPLYFIRKIILGKLE